MVATRDEAPGQMGIYEHGGECDSYFARVVEEGPGKTQDSPPGGGRTRGGRSLSRFCDSPFRDFQEERHIPARPLLEQRRQQNRCAATNQGASAPLSAGCRVYLQCHGVRPPDFPFGRPGKLRSARALAEAVNFPAARPWVGGRKQRQTNLFRDKTTNS